MMADTILQLKCYCNEYDEGQKGSSSLAARLCARTPGTDLKIHDYPVYFEMWMGTYPTLLSYVLENGVDLQEVTNARSKELVDDAIIEKFGHANLPCLPKVLSIAKALPGTHKSTLIPADGAHAYLSMMLA